MKKSQIKKNIFHRVKLFPSAKHVKGNVESGAFDDDWIIMKVNDEGVEINNTRTGHTTILGFDHIYSIRGSL
jgi:hypothetical protein